tara:strand:+ start:1361 stop:1795 length:435 start_codon:yes stop_codon:yes gene_type:complete
MEDRLFKMRGLYGMWTTCFVATMSVLATDEVIGSSRDFLLYTTLLSTLYCAVASVNSIYGNNTPSSMLLIAGPIHQYSFWLLLAYYHGDVYGSDPVGIMNGVNTGLVTAFNLDLLVKTWVLAIWPEMYKNYLQDVAGPEDISEV